MPRAATTANAILGLLSLRPEWPMYALTKQLSRNLRFFWPRAESRIYDEAKTLVTRGLATARETEADGRTRSVYAITDAGRAEVARWLASPPRPTALECEPLLRVFMADFCTTEQLLAAIAQVRADAEAIMTVGRTVGVEYQKGTAPFQDQLHARGLVFDFLWSHAEMLRDWADRADATVTSWRDQPETDRGALALETIGGHLERDRADLRRQSAAVVAVMREQEPETRSNSEH